jgi:hypothetical protein
MAFNTINEIINNITKTIVFFYYKSSSYKKIAKE